jgi:hypothetical protein
MATFLKGERGLRSIEKAPQHPRIDEQS